MHLKLSVRFHSICCIYTVDCVVRRSSHVARSQIQRAILGSTPLCKPKVFPLRLTHVVDNSCDDNAENSKVSSIGEDTRD